MDEHEDKRRERLGSDLLNIIGDLPIAYGLVCHLPAAHGDPLGSLNRLWYDHFDSSHRTWMVILNGDDEVREIEPLSLLLEAGAAFVVCDNTLLSKLEPVDITWFYDPDTGNSIEDIDYWEDQMIDSVQFRLESLGENLPDIASLACEGG